MVVSKSLYGEVLLICESSQVLPLKCVAFWCYLVASSSVSDSISGECLLKWLKGQSSVDVIQGLMAANGGYGSRQVVLQDGVDKNYIVCLIDNLII